MQKIKSFHFLYTLLIEKTDLLTEYIRHTCFTEPGVNMGKIFHKVSMNLSGDESFILGELNYDFSEIKNKNLTKAHTVVIGKKTRE